ncbi:MAG: exodeoxyribonuclease VII large subunit [Phycisphaerales bacterium]|nr:exodeoxyribonuclease VII large subunit [Phycisphaerales bacterium]
MPTLPFDWTPETTPSGPRPRKQGATSSGSKSMSVSELSKQIVGALETLPSSIRVNGELSSLKRSRNGHWYFSLKDDDALIDCAMWSSRARGVTCEPRDGDAVEVVGHVEHYAKQGRTQLIVERLQPQGQGTLQARFEALCAELRLLGWFENECKQPLPVLPRRIAVLTAGGSAALADVQRTSVDRCPSVQLLLVDVPVQGEGAAARIADAIEHVDAAADRLEVDAILVTRGGGSPEDLWAFNERVVAEAIFRCQTPIVAAVGHESDTSIAELVADHRASTPTQAVMALMPDADEIHHQLEDRSHRLRLLLRRQVEQARVQAINQSHHLGASLQSTLATAHRQLDAQARRLLERRPSAMMAARRASLVRNTRHLEQKLHTWHLETRTRLLGAARGMTNAMEHRLHAARVRFEALDATLEAVSPQAVLDRGFSLTLDEAGNVVRAAETLEQGAEIVTRFSRGRAHSRVETVEIDGSGTVESP